MIICEIIIFAILYLDLLVKEIGLRVFSKPLSRCTICAKNLRVTLSNFVNYRLNYGYIAFWIETPFDISSAPNRKIFATWFKLQIDAVAVS